MVLWLSRVGFGAAGWLGYVDCLLEITVGSSRGAVLRSSGFWFVSWRASIGQVSGLSPRVGVGCLYGLVWVVDSIPWIPLATHKTNQWVSFLGSPRVKPSCRL